MRLMDLHPQWIGAGGPGIFNADGTPSIPRHGIGMMFDCPKGCINTDWGEVDRHFVQFANPVDGGPPFEPERPKWTRIGEDFEMLTLTPSILSDPSKGGCGWHGFITNGEVVGA